MKTKVNVLGTDYEIIHKNYNEDPYFEKWTAGGYCDNVTKVICICNMNTYTNWEDETVEYCRLKEKETLRHELIHAFLNESGLCDNTGIPSIGWSKNEEMIDFFAIQFPKIVKTFRECDCL